MEPPKTVSLLPSLIAIVSAVLEAKLPLPVFSNNKFLLLVEMVELSSVFLYFRFLFSKYDLMEFTLLFKFVFDFKFLFLVSDFWDGDGGRSLTSFTVAGWGGGRWGDGEPLAVGGGGHGDGGPLAVGGGGHSDGGTFAGEVDVPGCGPGVSDVRVSDI